MYFLSVSNAHYKTHILTSYKSHFLQSSLAPLCSQILAPMKKVLKLSGDLPVRQMMTHLWDLGSFFCKQWRYAHKLVELQAKNIL